jgi:poly-gamma-glutamate capsule biosynthesis protein CapA/YwtB (metallophosphatase superfamily)
VSGTLLAVGDIGPLRDDAEVLFDPTRKLLQAADITFGQLEKCLSDRGTQQLYLNKSLARAAPRVAGVIAEAGFDVVSFASNHTLSYSDEGLFDTIDHLGRHGVKVIGAGENIDAARRPAVLAVDGTTVGLLAYCSVVPRGFQAMSNKPGLAPVRVRTFYEQRDWQPGTPPRIITQAYPEDVAAMADDIAALRKDVDVVVVSHHWGIHYVPAMIADYQFEVGHATIDAGADLVVGHHPHILKGIEVYRGKAIFYSIGSFALEHPLKDVTGTELAELLKQYNLEIDPRWVRYAFPVDSQKTTLVKCTLADGAIERVALVPAWINPQAQAEPVSAADPRHDEVLTYLRWLCDYYSLGTGLRREGDEIVIDLGGE